MYSFEESFENERYLEMLHSKLRKGCLCRFYCSGHDLMIGKGRHLGIKTKSSIIINFVILML